MPDGFVDLQVNGFGGVNFSDPALSPEDVQEVAETLAQRGTAAFLATVITSSPLTYEAVLPLLARCIATSACRGRILGLHLEGPFLSPEPGAVGAHPPQQVQEPSPAALDRLLDLAGGQVRLLTVAPERPGALDLIRHARGRGVTVAIGHTLANAEMVAAAIRAGATLSTHLGNGCPNQLHRHENMLWPQLASPELTAMLITDGHHLPPSFIRTAAAAKGASRLIVTSDAAPVAGCPPGEYEFFGTRVLLEPSGRLRNLQAPTLAGSSATLLDCMNHLASLDLFSESDLWRIGHDNPLAAIGLTGTEVIPPSSRRVRFAKDRFCLQA